MIKELRLTNWKSFDKSTLYIDPLTIVIGTNASGKSNIVDAFNFLRRYRNGVSLQEVFVKNSALHPFRGTEDWIVRRGEMQFSLAVLFETIIDDKVQDILIEFKFQKSSDNRKISAVEYLFTKLDDNKSINHFVGTLSNGDNLALGNGKFENNDFLIFREKATEIIYSIKDLIFILDPNPQKMRDYSSISDVLHEDASNLAGVLAGMTDDELIRIQNVMTEYTRRLPEKDIIKVWAEKFGIDKKDAILCCIERWNETEFTVDARSMSDGTLRLIAIIVAIMTRPAGSLLIIEEVDNGLHPSRASVLIEMLQTLGRDKQIDIVCTTHNTSLLNSLGNRMIPFISVVSRDIQSGNSKITTLDDVEQLPKLLASGPIGTMVGNGSLEASLKRNTTEK